MDPEESCIQEAIGQFYSFFGRMVQLKNDIEHLVDLDLSVRDRILIQLEDIESKCCVYVYVCVCVCVTLVNQLLEQSVSATHCSC